MEVNATMAATPITTPSIVRSDLILVAQILFRARAAVPRSLILNLVHLVQSDRL